MKKILVQWKFLKYPLKYFQITQLGVQYDQAPHNSTVNACLGGHET